jgi:hypothetical protein
MMTILLFSNTNSYVWDYRISGSYQSCNVEKIIVFRKLDLFPSSDDSVWGKYMVNCAR